MSEASIRQCGSEDWDFIYRVARDSKLWRIPDVLVEIRSRQCTTHAISLLEGGEARKILARHRCWAEANHNADHLHAASAGLALAAK